MKKIYFTMVIVALVAGCASANTAHNILDFEGIKAVQVGILIGEGGDGGVSKKFLFHSGNESAAFRDRLLQVVFERLKKAGIEATLDDRDHYLGISFWGRQVEGTSNEKLFVYLLKIGVSDQRLTVDEECARGGGVREAFGVASGTELENTLISEVVRLLDSQIPP